MSATGDPGRNRRDVAARVVPTLATAVLAPPALAVAALCVSRPADGSWPLAAGLLLTWAFVCAGSRLGSPATSRWLLIVCSLGLLAWPEVGLRLAGLRFDSAGVMRFGWPNLEASRELRKDPELFWTLSPRTAHANSRGFPGAEFDIEKAAGVRRILFFGDSCTQQGFPAKVERTLARRARTDARYEAINLGVAGYTSHQGRVLAKRWAHAMKPDLAIVLFGWNDHWLAHGSTDAEKSSGRTAAFCALTVGESRVLQWVGSLSGGAREEPLTVPRVSLTEYRENLIDIAAHVEAAGGHVILLTAPSAHERLGVPSLLIDDHLASSAEAVIEQHRAYNDEVRRVAALRGVPLVDLAHEADQRSEIASLFRLDGVHFTGAGLSWVRDRVVEAIAREKPDWFDEPL